LAVAKRSKTIVVEAYLYVSLLETIQVATRLKQKVMYQAIAELTQVHFVVGTNKLIFTKTVLHRASHTTQVCRKT